MADKNERTTEDESSLFELWENGLEDLALSDEDLLFIHGGQCW